MLRNPWRSREGGSLIVGFALWCTDRSEGLLRAAGVEVGAFRELLRVRLALDMRRGQGLDKVNLPLMLTLFWLSGMLPGLLAFIVHDPLYWAAFEIGFTSFMLGMVLMLQLGNLLLDGTDLQVVGPLPVGERTLYAARFAHALVYLGLIALCLHCWPAFLAMFGVVPWAPIALAPAAALATVFVVAAVALLYAAILRLFGPVRFQRVTLWVQIAISAFAMGGIHIVNRMIDWAAIAELLQAHPVALGAMPPVWFAGVFSSLAGEPSGSALALSALAVASPALLAWLSIRFASRGLVAGLTAVPEGRGRRRAWAPTPTRRLGALLARSRTERAGFDWALALSRREPAFLRTAYAQIAGLVMMGLSFAFLFTRDRYAFHPEAVPLVLYVLPLLVPTVLELGMYAEHPEGARLLRALPIDSPGRFHVGAVKALLAGTVLPAYVIVAGFCLALLARGGPTALFNTALALASSAWLGLATARRLRLALPFSRKLRHGNPHSANIAVVFGVLFVDAVLGGLHALLQWLLPAALPFAAVALALLALREYRALDAALVGSARRHDDTLEAEIA